MRRLGILAAVFSAGCGGIAPTSADWITQIYSPHARIAVLDSTNVQESSGLIASRLIADVLWTHNDSGSSGPRVWALRISASDLAGESARDLGYVELTGASNVDWEDIAAGPNGYVYVFDGGDNPPCNRTDKRIHRFVEPAIDPAGPRFTLSRPYESIRFEYPDSANAIMPADQDAERYDAECLMAHPATGDLYIVTKRTTANVGAARLYKLTANSVTWDSPIVHVLEYMGDLTGKLGVTADVVSTVTGGDIDAAGRRALIRRYGFAYEFTADPDAPFESAFAQDPTSLALAGEVQGEGICYGVDGGNIYSTSEVVFVSGIPVGPARCPIYITPWQLANLRATRVSPAGALMRWDTKSPADSRVDYGTTVAYGLQASSVQTVQSHAVPLTGLAPSTQYFYRVGSANLSWPPAAAAQAWHFTTRATVAPDLDADGDVDQEDFGHFQKCLSGPSVPQPAPECRAARFDEDDDVDALDFQFLHFCFSGPDIPAAPLCGPPL